MYHENDTFLVHFVSILVGVAVFLTLLDGLKDSWACFVLAGAGFAISYFVSYGFLKDYLRG